MGSHLPCLNCFRNKNLYERERNNAHFYYQNCMQSVSSLSSVFFCQFKINTRCIQNIVPAIILSLETKKALIQWKECWN